ncbi:hypothetical protein J2X84_002000 [Pseudomonas corrugata]|uniref:NACHT domain-containing protein n=1 Tax=Pseudomonas corrugata TaxID=47879 RepID=UPI00285CD55A|nr:hypothetical protein [Pseudomonas corrugata]MDR7283176.1 hypothetical protein [Pseudomonas corrugata]
MTSTKKYFPRQLQLSMSQGHSRQINEDELLEIAGPKIVLGEPGMGKSRLIQEIANRLSVKVVQASRFMQSGDPSRFVSEGKPLLIDGLDEAMSQHEGAAVDMVFAKLEDAGCPDFILCCRSREWQSRSGDSLQDIYDVEPSILTIEPFSRYEATSFLRQHHPRTDVDLVLDHLEAQGIADLYKNPLTLGLMGQVAESDSTLPATRAALFETVCGLIWPEHDRNRQGSGLGKISAEQAISAAGAISAGLLLAGADAVTLAGPRFVEDGEIRLVELESLPGTEAARAIFSSKLFQNAGAHRAKPIHRVIAEYLGARWLSQQAKSSRSQRRLLAQLHVGGSVPASLRGLHAWLAFHSSAMAKAVITADPFGVLRYGEVTDLTAEQAHCMFNALEALTEVDPLFRAQDWGSHSAAGLMTLPLRDKIESVITSTKSNPHLRSLLIEGLNGTPLAADLAETLEQIMFSPVYSYYERENAALALMLHRDRTWWQATISKLYDACEEDAFQLARHLIEELNCDVADNVLIEVMLASMGLLMCAFPRVDGARLRPFRYYRPIVEMLGSGRLINVLTLLTEYAVLMVDIDVEGTNDMAGAIASILTRAIDENRVTSLDVSLLWNSLGAMRLLDSYDTSEKKALQQRLDASDELRHAIQKYALFDLRVQEPVRMVEYEMNDRMIGLTWRPKDVIWFLEHLAHTDNKNTKAREDWCDLMQIASTKDGFDPDLREASKLFQAGDNELEAFVYKLENPEKPARQVKRELAAAQRLEKNRIAYEAHRQKYLKHRAELRAGELQGIVSAAKVYLGLHEIYDTATSQKDALVQWLGCELAEDAMAGLEAVLYRSALPSPADVAASFAQGTTWNYCYAIMAGMLARQRSGLGFADVSAEIKTIGLLLCLNNQLAISAAEVGSLRETLEPYVVATDSERDDFARLWLAPSIAARLSHISGLQILTHDKHWQSTGVKLAISWLAGNADIPENIELALIGCLTHAEQPNLLKPLAEARSEFVFESTERMLTWRAIDVLIRFDSVQHDLSDVANRYPEFIWHLRRLFQSGRRGMVHLVNVAQAKWIISQFRKQWPYATLLGTSQGDRNPYDATDFIRALVNMIASDTSLEASKALQDLILEPRDSYSDLILHMATEQRQKQAEEHFAPMQPGDLRRLLCDGPPSNMDDLKSLVLEELAVTQQKLIGDDLDLVSHFWNDNGVPYNENLCRDRLTSLITPALDRYDIQRITEADMPNTKRADLAFARGQLQLPMEVKGQWHPEVWSAAKDQLEQQYLIDWRSQRCGIYCVLWFGPVPSATKRRLKAPPNGLETPSSAEDMRLMLIDLLPQSLRTLIDVVVIDFEAGKAKPRDNKP